MVAASQSVAVRCAYVDENARLTLSWITESLGSNTVRKLSDRGQIGVRTRLCTEGWTIGPPAESEYAVDPVGVAMIKPSDCKVIHDQYKNTAYLLGSRYSRLLESDVGRLHRRRSWSCEARDLDVKLLRS